MSTQEAAPAGGIVIASGRVPGAATGAADPAHGNGRTGRDRGVAGAVGRSGVRLRGSAGRWPASTGSWGCRPAAGTTGNPTGGLPIRPPANVDAGSRSRWRHRDCKRPASRGCSWARGSCARKRPGWPRLPHCRRGWATWGEADAWQCRPLAGIHGNMTLPASGRHYREPNRRVPDQAASESSAASRASRFGSRALCSPSSTRMCTVCGRVSSEASASRPSRGTEISCGKFCVRSA